MQSRGSHHDWLGAPEEAQLSVDVFREGNVLVLRSPVAGVKPEDIDISLSGDLLTIRGNREHAREVAEEDWFYRENYWGAFSRSIVLPYDVLVDQAKAGIKNGILEVRIPISQGGKKLKVKWEE